jgi:cell wall-associated NlpC family hydrolase
MKLIACALPILASLPGVVNAQVKVGTSLGPFALVATISGHGVSVRARPSASGPAHRSIPSRSSTVPHTTARGTAASVLATAQRFLGVRYRYGGSTPRSGFDCSGFVQYVFGRNGVELPRTSRLQAHTGVPVPAAVDSLRPGDLMLFASKGSRVDHVAIYVGNNRMLHSSAGAGKVVYDDLSTPRGRWYLARHVASRRVV